MSRTGTTPSTFTYPYGQVSNESCPIIKKLWFKASLTCDYGVNIITKDPEIWRAILAPGGHIAWAALMGGALMTVKGTGKMRLSKLLHIKFLRIFIFVIIMHMFWDSSIPQPFLTNIPVYPIVLTIISWSMLFRMVRKGICEAAKPVDAIERFMAM